MKTLADFKKRISVGVQLHTIFHQAHGGRTETGLIVLMDQDKGVRPVTIPFPLRFARLLTTGLSQPFTMMR